MAGVTRRSFICTGQRIEQGRELLTPLYRLARERCPHLFVAEETRTFEALHDAVPLGFVDAMRKAGKPVTYLLFKDEGHGFARPENRMKFFAAAEAFLAKHLGGRAQPPSEAEKMEPEK